MNDAAANAEFLDSLSFTHRIIYRRRKTSNALSRVWIISGTRCRRSSNSSYSSSLNFVILNGKSLTRLRNNQSALFKEKTIRDYSV